MRALLALLITAAASTGAFAKPAEPWRLPPFKDELFAYRNILASDYGGDYLKIEFSIRRDMDERSQAPQVAKPEYVSLDVQSEQSDRTLRAGDLRVKYVAVGQTAGARAIVINVHGLGDNRFSGVKDWTYGGNQNRLKNLMVLSGGAYLSTDYSPFPALAAREVKALILDAASQSPGAPIFLLCISLGGRLCWTLAEDKQVAPLLGGVLFLSTDEDDGYVERARAADPRAWLPIYIGHSTLDPIFNWRPREAFFRRLKTALPDYPAQFSLFVGGGHGATVRMTDWRLVINRMLEQREALVAGASPVSPSPAAGKPCLRLLPGAPMPLGPTSQKCK